LPGTLREMGSAWGRAVREGKGPLNAGEISDQCSARKEATWRKKKMEEGFRCDEEGPVPTE
jgi:hypothetical protein